MHCLLSESTMVERRGWSCSSLSDLVSEVLYVHVCVGGGVDNNEAADLW